MLGWFSGKRKGGGRLGMRCPFLWCKNKLVPKYIFLSIAEMAFCVVGSLEIVLASQYIVDLKNSSSALLPSHLWDLAAHVDVAQPAPGVSFSTSTLHSHFWGSRFMLRWSQQNWGLQRTAEEVGPGYYFCIKLEWKIPFADALQLYQITCHVKPHPLCPSPVADDMERCKLEVALCIGESDFNDSAFVSILSRTPTLMIWMTALLQTPVFLLVSSSWREVELRCYKDYRLWMLARCSNFLSEACRPQICKAQTLQILFFSLLWILFM